MRRGGLAKEGLETRRGMSGWRVRGIAADMIAEACADPRYSGRL